MKILFLCGSLEPGRDGVGDYTRRLSGELLRHNHQIAIIALHDRQLSENAYEGAQSDEEQQIPVLRLSSQLSWIDRIGQTNTFIKAVDPDWISLQYVPFSFHDKGLHIGLGNLLKQVCKGRKVHIMFHELWVGMHVQAPTHYVWWGRLQRYYIQRLIATLKPNIVHTHTPLYQIQLSKLGVRASLLPLFSNIPIVEGQSLDMLPLTPVISDGIRFVFFGGIHPGSPAVQLATEVSIYASKKNISVDLIIVGRNSPEQETWANAWRSCGLDVTMLGEQSPAAISKVLKQSSIGLSTTPVALTGKSGSIAAMHAHGLPVLCVANPWQPRGIHELIKAPGIFQYALDNFESFITTYQSIYLPEVKLDSICQQFLHSLSSLLTKQTTNNSVSLSSN